MSSTNGYVSSARERREREAARLARIEALERKWASMPLATYLDVIRELGREEVLIWDESQVPWYTARHAELVAKYGA